MSLTLGGIFHDSTTKEEATGEATALASYVSPDQTTWTATSATPAQIGNIQAMVNVVLTDAEKASNIAVKFTSDRTDLEDLVVIFRAGTNLYVKSTGEDPVRCQRSGLFFPASRIRENANGKKFGDTYYVEADKEWGS
jgi:hypothetical protein